MHMVFNDEKFLSCQPSYFIDENLNRYETVYAAAGHPYVVFGILFDDLCKITNGSIESFVD